MDVYSIFDKRKRKNRIYKRYIPVLVRRHPGLKKLISTVGDIPQEVPLWLSIDDAILYSTIGQMLSVSAAGSIISRLLKKFGTSSQIIKWAEGTGHKQGPVEGVSQRKRKALAEWARFKKSSDRAWLKWKQLPLAEYRETVGRLWGFGPWSADMIAIFHLGRMDVWPDTDMGIQKVCRLVFETRDMTKAKKHVEGCETVAAIYMWELLNRKLESTFQKA